VSSAAEQDVHPPTQLLAFNRLSGGAQNNIAHTITVEISRAADRVADKGIAISAIDRVALCRGEAGHVYRTPSTQLLLTVQYVQSSNSGRCGEERVINAICVHVTCTNRKANAVICNRPDDACCLVGGEGATGVEGGEVVRVGIHRYRRGHECG
jgi:hypothetical protein